jgi:hypothetical protein
MTEMILDQNDEEVFTYEVSDEALETAGACLERQKANTFTQFISGVSWARRSPAGVRHGFQDQSEQ